MKICAALVVLAVSGPWASAQAPAQSTGAALTPTERRIAAAEEAIRKDPGPYQAYDDLAYNLVKLAEETSDARDLEKAEAALAKSFAIAPKNFQGEKTEVFALLAEHEYSKALDEAKALNKQTPDDVLIWGYLADAESALGDYDDAEKAAQWMINLRPGNVPGLLRGAYLRSVWGDADGAMEFLNQAFQETPPFETGDVASILATMAEIQLAAGKAETAAKLDEEALRAFPDYWRALASLARARTAQRRFAEALELLEKRNARSPRPQSLYALAETLERAGRSDEAKRAYASFERQARQEINQADNANLELVFYYTDHASNPAEALRLASSEAARRHDVYTLDAYAWALHASHDDAGARTEIARALAVGVRDAGIFYRAGAISASLGDRAAAAKYMRQSLALDPAPEVSPAARQALGTLGSSPGSKAVAASASSTGHL